MAGRDLSAAAAVMLSQIRVIGRGEMYVENYKRISRYRPDCVELILPDGVVSIAGEELVIRDISAGAVKICGKIGTIDFNTP